MVNLFGPQIERVLTESVDVGMVDFGAENDLGGDHWVLFWQEELKLEQATVVRRVLWSCNLHEEVSAVGLRGGGVDADDYRRLPEKRDNVSEK